MPRRPPGRCRPRSQALPSGESLEGDGREGVLHVPQRLDLAGDEVADVGLLVEIALHQQVVLARGRVDLRHALDRQRLLGDLVSLAELALHHHENRLHALADLGEEGRDVIAQADRRALVAAALMAIVRALAARLTLRTALTLRALGTLFSRLGVTALFGVVLTRLTMFTWLTRFAMLARLLVLAGLTRLPRFAVLPR